MTLPEDLTHDASQINNLIEAVNVGLVLINLDRQILHMNRNATIIFHIDEDPTDKNFKEVFESEVANFFDEMLDQMESQGFVMDRQLLVSHEGGMQLAIGINIAYLLDKKNQKVGYVLNLRDMTASEELDRLRRLDNMKSDFVNNVSHELRTPLTSIKAYTEALQGMLEEPMHQKFLSVINDESDRLLGLIENLLNVSRIESGKMTLNRQEVQILDILNRIVEITKVQSDKHNIILCGDVEIPIIKVDPDKVMEVFLNLVSNAIKYSPDGGDVTIEPKVKDGNIEVSIIDQGLGLSDQDMKKVFEQFYRVDHPQSESIGGTGLGLAITQSIVKAHGGSIRVESQLGVGSKFTVLFPVDEDQASDEIHLFSQDNPFV